jgi:oxidoreductase
MPFVSRWLGFISLPLQVAGANPQTSAFYLRSKGLTEQALAELGYKDTIIFRPMLLSNVQRPEKRLGETLAMYVPLPDLFRLQSV